MSGEMSRPVVAVVHATPASLAPVTAAFASGYPPADLWHLLDDRLDRDALAAGGLNAELAGRMERLIQYAVDAGADAVQLACSMYGPVAGRVEHPVPVVPADRGVFDRVAELAPRRVLILASLAPAATDSQERLTSSLAEAGQEADVFATVADSARAAALAGDLDALTDALAAEVEAMLEAGRPPDVVALAQYSLSTVADRVEEKLGIPVLGGPPLAATNLARLLADRAVEAS
ncbi:hypothetical protein FXB39_08240 [Nocardioides sp. BGMRC 2183]|nr:hypothetical protein FXB39_08240 [Nocardioides sp. BGMRC 2183]